MTQPARFSIGRIYLAQVVVAVVVGAIFAGFSVKAGVSFWLGALVMAIANGFFAWNVMKCQRMVDPTKAVLKFMLAELGKLVIMGLGVVIIAKWLTVEWWAVIIGILVSYFGLFVPVLIKWK